MEFTKRLTSDELSSRGRIKTFAHKWQCFEKLKMYEQIGTIEEFKQLKELADANNMIDITTRIMLGYGLSKLSTNS